MNSASMNDNERMMIEKSVRFEENTSFRTVEHQRDMTADHRDLLWYNDDDFERIKSDIRNDIKTARRLKRKQGHCHTVCTLGIEHLLSASALRSRIESKNAAIGAVLKEQERLHRVENEGRPPVDVIGIPFSVFIANASMASTHRDRQDAIARAD